MTPLIIASGCLAALLCVMFWWNGRQATEIAELRAGTAILLQQVVDHERKASQPKNQTAEQAYRDALEYISTGKVALGQPIVWTADHQKQANSRTPLEWWWMAHRSRVLASNALHKVDKES